MERERKTYIDMSKGIGILLVIYGHCMSQTNIVVAWQCSFFMPLFFLCSGFIYNSPKTIVENAKKILIPFYVYGTVGLFLEIGLGFISKEIVTGWWVFERALKLLFGMSMWNYPIWFLVAFFTCKCVFDMLITVYRRNLVKYSKLFCIAMSSVCFVVGLILALYKNRYGFFYPFRFDVGLTMVPFMILGCALKNIFERICDKSWKTILAASILFVINIIAFINNTLVSVNSSDYGNPFLFLLSSVSGSLFIILVCYIFDYFGLINQILSWYGRNSMIIMCTHAIALAFISKIILLLDSKIRIPFNITDMIKFICCVIIVIPIVFLCDRLKSNKHKKV